MMIGFYASKKTEFSTTPPKDDAVLLVFTLKSRVSQSLNWTSLKKRNKELTNTS
jgi:hypothetical protein